MSPLLSVIVVEQPVEQLVEFSPVPERSSRERARILYHQPQVEPVTEVIVLACRIDKIVMTEHRVALAFALSQALSRFAVADDDYLAPPA